MKNEKYEKLQKDIQKQSTFKIINAPIMPFYNYLRCRFTIILDDDASNTSLNKFPVWHIHGTTVVKSIWFLGGTKLQMFNVEISWWSDV